MIILGSSNPIIQLIIEDLKNRFVLYSCINIFLNPAVVTLFIVGGIKIGWSFLKRSFK